MVVKISSKNRKRQAFLLIENAEERIKSANILLENKLYNDAISRAYYAFFDAANALLVTKGLMAKTHAGVINLFSMHFIKTKQVPVEYIKYFRQAKTAREEADYELLKKFNKQETQDIINTAEGFIKFIKDNILCQAILMDSSMYFTMGFKMSPISRKKASALKRSSSNASGNNFAASSKRSANR